ncbi:helix-turn-helix domain-containing protein, partial [Paenibacillus oleatilyticus]|uniref:helix-turn-helix domain-containing protein n=1 Tax=Paenibacillus oleatilyticus TaxID=2594886 RepID=UPI0035A5E1ED
MNQYLLCIHENICAIIVVKLRKEVDARMLHHKAFRFRIYPTEEQTTLIHQMFGCARFVSNHFLARWNDTFQE